MDKSTLPGVTLFTHSKWTMENDNPYIIPTTRQEQDRKQLTEEIQVETSTRKSQRMVASTFKLKKNNLSLCSSGRLMSVLVGYVVCYCNVN